MKKILCVMRGIERAFVYDYNGEHWQKMWVDAHREQNKHIIAHAKTIIRDDGTILILIELEKK